MMSRDGLNNLSRVKLMDSGSIAWPRVATGFEVAPSSTMDASGYEIPAGDWIWDSSDLWHYQIITAHVEPFGAPGGAENGTPGAFIASCREGSSATPLLKGVAWGLFVALTLGAAWWLRSGWVVAIGFGLLLLTLWVVLRPAQKNVRRMLRLSREWHL